MAYMNFVVTSAGQACLYMENIEKSLDSTLKGIIAFKDYLKRVCCINEYIGQEFP